ncbi:hypothetical protein [Ruania halotolerans]|uniref:hypothetical protein n=1 Tax=Ruania halotolerans TaxID=2897773 RepID=UPI001E5217CF|nr:hypothetical protein [Ruania halotolerans]UFU05877.1 hypothetical protein LQF10_15800 [Ruania halotolerans]
MTQFDPRYPDGPLPRPDRWTTGRIVAVIVSAIVAVPFLVIMAMLVSFIVAPDPATDPHGYAQIFGSVTVIVLGFLLVCIGPWALPQRVRARAFTISGLSLLALIVGLFLALD